MKMKDIATVREEILEKAKLCVCGDREDDYGSPEQNFQTIAEMWRSYLGWPVEADDVAAMMALVKIARISNGRFNQDNWVDLAGYAACGGEIQMSRQQEAAREEIKINVEKILSELHEPHGIRYTATERVIKEVPICPECGQECETYYVDEENDVIGCENCLSRTDAVQYIMEEMDRDEP